MAFPRELLAGHEKIVFELRPHWVAALPSVGWTILVLIGWWLGRWAAEELFSGNTEDTAKIVIAGIPLIVWVFLAVIPFLRWRFTLFVLTTDRLITRSGIIAKHSKEIPLERINDVSFNQSVVERALKAGDLMVESAGERGQTQIRNVRNPEQVQLMIYKETEANNNRMMRPPAEREQNVTDQLEALGRLRKDGVISEAEFEAKKRELLDRM
jgi:uncharacterized membrane protein YdbT with pleckstrin-like domain